MRKAYQTLEDRVNYDYVENFGPFQCNHEKAWLGSGYYFWDSFIENAHWWGAEGACYNNGYIICESTFELDNFKCFNLVDNPEHLRLFNDTRKLMREKGLYIPNVTTVSRIIQHIKETIKVFRYEAIRVYGINSVSFGSQYSNRTIFKYKKEEKSFQYLDSTPAIQICFYEKKSLGRKDFKIIYPPELCEDYLV